MFGNPRSMLRCHLMLSIHADMIITVPLPAEKSTSSLLFAEAKVLHSQHWKSFLRTLLLDLLLVENTRNLRHPFLPSLAPELSLGRQISRVI